MDIQYSVEHALLFYNLLKLLLLLQFLLKICHHLRFLLYLFCFLCDLFRTQIHLMLHMLHFDFFVFLLKFYNVFNQSIIMVDLHLLCILVVFEIRVSLIHHKCCILFRLKIYLFEDMNIDAIFV